MSQIYVGHIKQYRIAAIVMENVYFIHLCSLHIIYGLHVTYRTDKKNSFPVLLEP